MLTSAMTRPLLLLVLVAASMTADEEVPAWLNPLPVRVHDPATIVSEGKTAWLFSTGYGIKSDRSTNLTDWTSGPRVFDRPRDWFRKVAPQNRGHLWAPDIIRGQDRYLLYYSVSQFGKQTSAIALASNKTLDPRHQDYEWRDEGIVLQSKQGERYNAIDPAIVRDGERLWMSFGSFWEGIFLVGLDPKTGKRKDPDERPQRLASTREIEAPFIHKHGDDYYLFVNWGICCRGVRSTYEIRVGRSKSITGPYRDREGTNMRDGGGTLVLGSHDGFIGPGHSSIVRDCQGRERLACHFYDATQRGRACLALPFLTWSKDGWPVVKKPAP